jgi:hypothetical protein
MKIGKGLGTKAMEDMLLYNKEMRKFSYVERMSNGAASDPGDRELNDK